MRKEEVIELNQYLHRIGEEIKNKPSTLFVDNLHSAYLEFEEEYVLPSQSLSGIEYSQAKRYIETISEFIPEAVRFCSVLPEPKPRRDIGKLFLVRDFIFNNNLYLYILKLEATHLGGIFNDKIVVPAYQGSSVSVRTKRIYFSIRVIRIESLVKENEFVLDFNAAFISPQDLSIDKGQSYNISQKVRVELFDDVDYSGLLDPIKEKQGIKAIWKPGKIYDPISIEYRSLAFNFLESSYKEIYNRFSGFLSVYDNILFGREDKNDEHDSYLAYLSSIQTERTLSPSGNLLWKVYRR
ncbi:MAG: hypothetical protein H7A25_19250 [Leptospiraceae bacterium]|nr:hypothetical protein [Leptospiraceae bacterium]